MPAAAALAFLHQSRLGHGAPDVHRRLNPTGPAHGRGFAGFNEANPPHSQLGAWMRAPFVPITQTNVSTHICYSHAYEVSYSYLFLHFMIYFYLHFYALWILSYNKVIFK